MPCYDSRLQPISSPANMTKKLLSTAITLALTMGFLGVSYSGASFANTSTKTPTKSLVDKPGVDREFFDGNVAACTDFYRYAIGKWQDASPIPADRARWGAFDEIESRNREVLIGVLKEAAKSKAPAGSNKAKLGDYFASGLAPQDKAKATATALSVVNDTFDRSGIAATLGRMHAQGTPAGLNFAVRQDQKNSTRYIVQLFQGGLGLPEREYYFAKDDRAQKQRDAYVKHIAAILTLAGDTPTRAQEAATQIMALETKLAEAAMTRLEARDPDKTYNLMTLADLQKRTGDFKWNDFFDTLGIKNVGDLNIGQPKFFEALAALTVSESKTTWRDYLRWHALRSLSPAMGGEFEKENFAFYGRELTGVEEMETRERRVTSTIDRTMGDALGELYVAKAFSPTAKARALDLVKNVRAALRQRISELDWMSDATKKEATAKLDAMEVKIGYPDKWKDYSQVEIRRDDYLGNVIRATRAEFQRQIDRLGKPVDRSVWGMTPPTVNAYYSSALNEIVFPAGILQSPFFNEKADDAANYGGIGMVIGHEFTHGFDDRGRKFDAVGNRRDWWTTEDAARYTAKADAIAKQYDAFAPLPNMNINGKFTLGENIADFGGLRIAYLGLQMAEAAKPANERNKVIDSMTTSQRFFLNYAQSWRQNMREAELRRRLMTDSHSPARFRVLGPLGNLPEFGKAFSCKEGDKMIRAASEQVTVW
jgi:putative endopeptidase